MKDISLLTNHFLIAMPSLTDDDFSRAVIYVCEDSDEGSMGLVINKPLPLNLGSVLKHLDIQIESKETEQYPVLMGGPVGQENGFIISNQPIKKEEALTNKVSVTSSKETLRSIAHGNKLGSFIITLGYTGWEPGQLKKEIQNNYWLIAPFDRKILFETPIDKRWEAAARLIGLDINRLSAQVGHA